MTITVGETTTQVLVNAFTMLRVEGVALEVRNRTAWIDTAEVHWVYRDGAWRIDFVWLTGRYLKVNGTPGRQPFKDSSKPSDGSERQYGNVTPPEIVDAALALTPDWVPKITPSRYARTTKKETSL